MEQKKVLIAGGSGLIGKKITHKLTSNNYKVAWLSRTPVASGQVEQYFWDPFKSKIDVQAINGVHSIINLSGAGIADKIWTRARKKLLIDSRTKSTRLLYKTLNAQKNSQVKNFINASAIGYYGNRPGELLSENKASGSGFLCNLCQQWEHEALKLSGLKTNVTIVRIGVVLAKESGSLPVFKKVSKLPLLALPGGGKQMLSWVHIDDLVEIFYRSVVNNSSGIVNGVAPNPVNLNQFFQILAGVHKSRKIIIPLPSKPIKMLLGSMSEIIMNDQKIVPQKLLDDNFQWNYAELNKALQSLV